MQFFKIVKVMNLSWKRDTIDQYAKNKEKSISIIKRNKIKTMKLLFQKTIIMLTAMIHNFSVALKRNNNPKSILHFKTVKILNNCKKVA